MKLATTLITIWGILFVVPLGMLAQSPQAHENLPAMPVSLIKLIATPSDFDGERVRVVGYLGGAGLDKTLGLYLSESDGRNGAFMNAIVLPHLEPQKVHELVGGYVLLSATFHAPGSHSGSNGYLDEITEIKKWPALQPK